MRDMVSAIKYPFLFPASAASQEGRKGRAILVERREEMNWLLIDSEPEKLRLLVPLRLPQPQQPPNHFL